MSRVEDALMRLYENADLRDELTDDEAATLLKWAETELTRLDTPAVDDDTFEAQVDTLMKLLKQMNRYAGRQGQGFAAQSLASQGVDETPGKIAALAAELGHAADSGQVAAAGTGEPGSTVAALTAMMSPSPPEIPPTEQLPADATGAAPVAAPTEPRPDAPPDTPLPPTDANAETWEMDDDYEA